MWEAWPTNTRTTITANTASAQALPASSWHHNATNVPHMKLGSLSSSIKRRIRQVHRYLKLDCTPHLLGTHEHITVNLPDPTDRPFSRDAAHTSMSIAWHFVVVAKVVRSTRMSSYRGRSIEHKADLHNELKCKRWCGMSWGFDVQLFCPI